MKRILLISVTLVTMLLSACGAPTTTSEPTPTPTSAPATPQVFEKDLIGIPFVGWFDPELVREEQERGTLRFSVETGNRVEGEVALVKYFFSQPGVPASIGIEEVFAFVRDPYENILLQSAFQNVQGGLRSSQKFPWRFSFVASTTGEFSLHVLTPTLLQDGGYDAHLKVTVYEK